MSVQLDIVTTFSVRILRLFFGFASTMILARWLKPEGMGVLATFLAVPMIFVSLGELGIRQSIAFHVGQKKFQLKQIAGAVTSLWFFTSTFSMILVFIIFYFQGLFEYGAGACLLGSGLIAANLLTKYSNGIALGKQWIGRINLGEICNILARFTLIVLLVVIFNLHVSGALWMEMIAIMVPGVLMLFWLKKYLHLSFTPCVNYALLSSLFVHGIKYALALFAITMNYRISILFLQAYDVPNDQIGNFSIGMKIAELVWLLPSAVGMVLFSYSTGIQNGREMTTKTAQVMRINFLFCALGALVLFWVCPYFVRIVFGSEYVPSAPVIRYMLPGIVVMVIFKILNANLAGKGKPLVALKVFILALSVNILLNIILVPSKGIIGAALASTVSYCTAGILMILLFAKESNIRTADVVYSPVSDYRAIISIFQRAPFIRKQKP